jgi:outer membrane protein assembly factor BamB
MKNKYITLTLILLISAIALSACSGSAFIPSGWTGVTVDQDTAYVSHNQYVYAVNLSNGEMIWRFPEKGQANKTFYAPPILIEGDQRLLAGSYNNILYSINPSTTEEISSFESRGHFIAAPLVTEDGIFAPSGDDRLYALDENLNLRWEFQAKSALWAEPVGSPDGRVIYLPSMDHNLYALHSVNGRLIWSQDLKGALVGSPTLSEDGSILYIGSFSNNMFAVDAASGNILWETPLNGWVWSGPALHENVLYFGDLSGNLYALDAKTGSLLWERQPDGPIAGTPLIVENTIYVGSESGSLTAYDLNGNYQWSQTIGGKIYTSPVFVEDTILVAPIETDYRLVALNLSGTQKWRFTPPR